MILVDWTRMGKTYCLAGVVVQEARYRVVRPILTRYREGAVRNAGWSAYLLDGHARWDVFELIGPQQAPPDPPHLEDIWVRSLRPQRRAATREQRLAILAATAPRPTEPLFGVPLAATRSAGYLQPGSGQRSLATLVIPCGQITFGGSWRAGAGEADLRVKLPIPELGERVLPVKDHHLLSKIEQMRTDLDRQLAALNTAVRQMGEQVAVRLGLSRPFPPEDGRESPRCWLMADGFFSQTDPRA
jgi:hypothetical protein